MKVISNNPLVIEKMENTFFVEGTPLDVLLEVRKHLGSGDRLVSMPLPANQRLFMNPYRSIVVDEHSAGLSMKSMQLLENAIERFRMQAFNRSSDAEKDFALIDLEQVLTVLKVM